MATTINDSGQHFQSTYGGILMAGTVTISGTSASAYNQTGSGVGLGMGSATVFNVADVTGDGQRFDFTVNGILRAAPRRPAASPEPVCGHHALGDHSKGTSAYSGTATISAGTLILGDGTSVNDAMLPSSTTIADNAALVINNFANQVYSSETVNGTGTLTKSGAGSLIFDSGGLLSYTGGTTVNGGILRFDNAHSVTGPLTVNSGATFVLTDFVAASYLIPSSIDLTGGTITGYNATTANTIDLWHLRLTCINIHGNGLTSRLPPSVTPPTRTPIAPPLWMDPANDGVAKTLTSHSG